MVDVNASDIRRVVNEDVAPEVLDLWNRKNKGYGEQLFDFDVRAQALEINRKNGKIKDALWHGKRLEFETLEEVLMDMIGHCLITIARLRLEGDPNDAMPAIEFPDDAPCICGSGELLAWCRCREKMS